MSFKGEDHYDLRKHLHVDHNMMQAIVLPQVSFHNQTLFTHHSNPFICKRGSGHLSGFLLTLTTRLSHIDCPLLGLAGSPSSLHVRWACGKTLDLETSTGAIIIYLSNCNFISYLHQGHLHRLPIRGSGRVSLVIASECVPSATQITGHYLPKAWVWPEEPVL